MDELKPSLARRVMFLSQYDFNIIHKDGKLISNADSLSRQIYEETNDSEEDAEPELYILRDIGNTKKSVFDFADIYLQILTEQNIRKAQNKDYWFRSFYQYIDTEQLPQDSRMSKRIQNLQHQYIIHNKLLYHIWRNNQKHLQFTQLCIPEEFRTVIMQSLHDLKATGHASTMKMYHSALSRFWWPGTYTYFENYVASCKVCLQSYKGHYTKIPLKPLSIPDGVFHTLHVIHTHSKCFRYMLVIIDAFSKFVVVKCLKSKHANIVTKAIYQEWFLRFGFPKHICYVVHDNGLEFVNKWNKALFEIINVKSIKTSVYVMIGRFIQ